MWILSPRSDSEGSIFSRFQMVPWISQKIILIWKLPFISMTENVGYQVKGFFWHLSMGMFEPVHQILFIDTAVVGIQFWKTWDEIIEFLCINYLNHFRSCPVPRKLVLPIMLRLLLFLTFHKVDWHYTFIGAANYFSWSSVSVPLLDAGYKFIKLIKNLKIYTIMEFCIPGLYILKNGYNNCLNVG